MSVVAPAFVEGLALLAPGYDVILCDVWGVVHNGLVSFPAAGEALACFRAGGGSVVLITNAPRPGEAVIRMLDRLGVRRTAYDAIVSSGDVTRGVIAARPHQSVFHLGPERDRPIFAGLDLTLTAVESADYVVCTGLFDDDTETVDDYAGMLAGMRARDLFMVCANPDIVVERGDRLIYCAGALADRYGELGGGVLYAGKPHRPIYDAALDRAAAVRGASVPRARVLAIGDSVRTDLNGAQAFGVDCLFITGGIHAEELGARDNPDVAALGAVFAAAGADPKAVMPRLVW